MDSQHASNNKTLETYNTKFDNYVAKTIKTTDDVSTQGQWLLKFLSYLAKDAMILEIGSAHGRDARFMLDKGYVNVQTSDAFDSALDYLLAAGFRANKLNIITENPDKAYNAVFASAVFLHFTRSEMKHVLVKLKDFILPNGLLAFSVKKGVGDEWTTDKMDALRYFCYWNEGELKDMLSELAYDVRDIRVVEEDKWICVIASPVQ